MPREPLADDPRMAPDLTAAGTAALPARAKALPRWQVLLLHGMVDLVFVALLACACWDFFPVLVYRPVVATVISSTREHRWGWHPRARNLRGGTPVWQAVPVVGYQYVVGGQSYTGDRIGRTPDDDARHGVTSQIKWVTPGRVVWAYYNPFDPSQVMLVRNVHLLVLGMIAFIGMFLRLWVVLLAGPRRRRGAHRR
jgi:hypothetical protein